MRTFIAVISLIGSCIAVPQTFEKSVDYEIPSGKVTYSSHVPVDGVYGQHFGGVVQPGFRYGQTAVKSVYGGYVKPVVKPAVTQPVQEFQTYGAAQPVHVAQTYSAVQPVHVPQTYGVAQPVHDKFYDESFYGKAFYGGYAQPAVRYNVPSKVVKPVVPFVQPATPVVNKYVPTAKFAQSIAPVVHHFSPAVHHATPAVHHVSPFVQQVSPVAYPTKYSFPGAQHSFIQPVEKVVKPFVQPVVQPYAKFAHVPSPVARIGHVSSPIVQSPYVHPVAKYSPVATPVHHHHDVVAKTVEAPAAIISQTHDVSVDGTFAANFQTENGIQSAVSGSVKPVFGSDEPAQVMSGSYSYTSPEGTPVVTHWYADETGFHAGGDHIPAIPEEIQRSLEYISAQPVSHEEIKYGHF